MKDVVKVFFAFVMAVMMSTSVYAQHHGDDTHHKTSGDDPVVNSDDPTLTKDGKAGVKTDDGLLYGEDFKSGEVMEFSEVIASKDKLHNQVVTIKGYISEVCAKAGCWMTLTDGDKSIRVLTMHNFLVPTGFYGKNAVISGTFKVREFSEEEEEHYNEESANPKETIEKREETYELEATGVKFVD